MDKPMGKGGVGFGGGELKTNIPKLH